MSNSYMPRREVEILRWLRNFGRELLKLHESVGVSLVEAEAFHALFLVAEGAFGRANVPETRTSPAVRAKDDAMAAAERRARELVRVIVSRETVTDEQRVELGLRVPKRTRSRVGPPKAAPRLRVAGVEAGRVCLMLNDADEAANGRPRRPRGVKAATVMMHAGEGLPERWGEWSLVRSTSDKRVVVDLDGSLEPERRVWFTAFWLSPTLEAGPPCAPVGVRVGFGGITAAEKGDKEG